MLCYAIRHGESTSNANQTAEVNCGLSPLGVEQSQRLAERLACAGIAAIYSSPYRRALHTATALAERAQLPILVRSELCEYHATQPPNGRAFQPPDWSALAAEFPRARRDEADSAPSPWAPLAETLPDVIARTRRLAAHLKARWTGIADVVAIFSHGSPIARLIDGWLSEAPGPSFRFIIDNAAVSALRHHDGVSSLVCLNDASHLVGLPPSALSVFRPDRTVVPEPPRAYW